MSINIINKKVYKLCNRCENNQEIKLEENIFQDISGRYLICSKCNNLMPTEYDDDYFNYHDIK